MKNNVYPKMMVDPTRTESVVTTSGAVLLTKTVDVSGLGADLTAAMAPWRTTAAVHDPAKIVLDLAMTLAAGGDCVADVAAVRAQPQVYGQVASDPTMSRVITRLAADVEAVSTAISAARAAARERVWATARPLEGIAGSVDGGLVIVDLDATTVTAGSAKEQAQKTYKRVFGHSPMCSFVDHGAFGTGETLHLDLRRGGASPKGADMHIAALEAALAQLPAAERAQVLIRTDSAGCAKKFLAHLAEQNLQYSVGFTISELVKDALAMLPEAAWVTAITNDDADPRADAQVAEITLPRPVRDAETAYEPWPPGMRLIVRREYPHNGAQHLITDIEGRRYTVFATNTRGRGWTLPTLELRHRQRARAEDRIRCLKDTGMANLPFDSFAKNQLWLDIVALASDLLAWTQTLGYHRHHPIRRWEPKRLRHRLLTVAGKIITHARTTTLRLPTDWPYNHHIRHGWQRLAA
ncbi:Transposase DDE domain group 1 [Gordonia westfalica]|uniref:Transposase DDE domain group 1 n=2 Tax=Gordonia westfalica TaxID=158898 RepID=A0A1H2KXQ8_9ACTN|nr:Transposase DDE domain group 1 [Gordonia westfalica]